MTRKQYDAKIRTLIPLHDELIAEAAARKPNCYTAVFSMRMRSTAQMVRVRRADSRFPVVAIVSLHLLGGVADVGAQAPDRVRLSLLEASVGTGSRSCSLEVVVSATAGEAILTCSRDTQPVSHLGAYRALTTSEAARLYALASGPALTPPPSGGSSAPASVERSTATITITRGAQRVVLDVSEGPKGLSANEQQTWRLLREITDELRGTGRR